MNPLIGEADLEKVKHITLSHETINHQRVYDIHVHISVCEMLQVEVFITFQLLCVYWKEVY